MGDARVMRDFHVRREPRERYAVTRQLFGSRGDLILADLVRIRSLAARMNSEREPGSPPVYAGEIAALGLLHEIGHVLIARYEERQATGAIARALADLEATLGPDATRLLDRFGQEFPGPGPEP